MDQLLTGLRAVAEPTRLRILALCWRGELTAGELTRTLGQSQPRVSRHLKLLCEAGLLERFQEGTWAFFHLPPRGVGADLVRALLAQIPEDDATMARDVQRLEMIKQERAERANSYFGENAARWDRIRALHVDEVEVEQALVDLLPQERVKSLLDIGTGTGRVLQLLDRHVDHGLGLDLSREMLSVARANLADPRYAHCTLRQADMYQLPVEEGAFDLIVLHMVLHFSDRPANVIAEAARALAPGGHFMIVDFAPHSMEELRDEHAHRRLGFARDEVEAWCLEHGLDVIEVRDLDGDPLTVSIWKTRSPQPPAAQNAA
ncbi:MAG: metalloregulator ArsR/SmtB family transcription factor [Alphaproteobacteria bacterium]|nr:metalloregulator ArsR/SmtB family transcription factor [Alphaproteobacteria bacterium]